MLGLRLCNQNHKQERFFTKRCSGNEQLFSADDSLPWPVLPHGLKGSTTEAAGIHSISRHVLMKSICGNSLRRYLFPRR